MKKIPASFESYLLDDNEFYLLSKLVNENNLPTWIPFFIERTRRLMQEKMITMSELADILQIAQPTLSGYLNISGVRKENKTASSIPKIPNILVVVAIADYFDVSIDYLLGKTNYTQLSPYEKLTSLYDKTGITQSTIDTFEALCSKHKPFANGINVAPNALLQMILENSSFVQTLDTLMESVLSYISIQPVRMFYLAEKEQKISENEQTSNARQRSGLKHLYSYIAANFDTEEFDDMEIISELNQYDLDMDTYESIVDILFLLGTLSEHDKKEEALKALEYFMMRENTTNIDDCIEYVMNTYNESVDDTIDKTLLRELLLSEYAHETSSYLIKNTENMIYKSSDQYKAIYNSIIHSKIVNSHIKTIFRKVIETEHQKMKNRMHNQSQK